MNISCLTQEVNDFAASSPIHEAAKLENFSDEQFRAKAMAIVLTWIEEGNFSYDALNLLVTHDADVNENGEIDDDEQDFYNSLFVAVAEALDFMGADTDTIADFINTEDDDAGEKIGVYMADVIDNEKTDDGELISKYAIKIPVMENVIVDWDNYKWGDSEFDPVLESAFKKVKSFKKTAGGAIKKVIRKKRISGHVKLSAKQKKAIKKMQRKSHKSAAKKNRAKTMKKRKSMGY